LETGLSAIGGTSGLSMSSLANNKTAGDAEVKNNPQQNKNKKKREKKPMVCPTTQNISFWGDGTKNKRRPTKRPLM